MATNMVEQSELDQLLEEFESAAVQPGANAVDLITNYLIPTLKSMRDDYSDGLNYIEDLIDQPDAEALIEQVKASYAALLEFNVAVLKHHGYMTGDNINDRLPAELKPLADAAVGAAKAFFDATRAYAVAKAKSEVEEDEQEDDDKEGA